GLGNWRICIEEDALAHLVDTGNGDARTALNALELAALTTPPGKDGERHITLQVAEE
ncbi:MAG TPA: AAA family ATPase, partial [Armatimonadetes bacterium]|nr:AAA family ATPase [Armatimonadota bacterium]